MNIATLFSGGEGIGIGARNAGLEHLWGIEYEDDIAQVARASGFPVLTADVTQVDPDDFERPDVLHASPPCPNFSVAKAGREETKEDISLARATAHFIEILQPDFFTLENVYLYRKSKSWRLIAHTLKSLGYGFKHWHLNSADYGVPQTRKRMIAIARRDGKVPQPPHATHAHPDDLSPMFDDRKPWMGWYEAVEDLIPDLPDSEFAPWQLNRLPDELKTVLVDSAGYLDGTGKRVAVQRNQGTPSNVIVANHARRPMRGFIVSNAKTKWSNGLHDTHEPALSVTKQHQGRLRAFVVDGKLSSSNSEKLLQINNGALPYGTVVTSRSAQRDSRACINGRVVQMTARALARFQSFPDWYELPDKKTLACRIIGNAVPPLMYERIIESIQRG